MSGPARLASRLLRVRPWVLAALVFSALMRLGGVGDESRLSFLDPALLAAFLWAVGVAQRRHAPPALLRPSAAALAFIALSWLAGMLFELTLSEGGGETFGGFHPETLPSFVLAQGFYVPFAVLGFVLVRRYAYTLRELFFAAGAVSIYEILATGTLARLVTSPFFILAPLAIAYYVSVYAMFLCWPVVLLGTEQLWGDAPRPVSGRRKVVMMLAMGAGSWLVSGAWGVLLPHLSTRLSVP